MKVQKINQLAESLGNIPKVNLDSTGSFIGKSTSSLLESSLDKDVFSGIINHLDDASQLQQGSETLTQLASHAEHSFMGGSMLLRLIDPVKEASKGNFVAAIKKTAVHAVDVAIYKARLIYGALGAIRGLIVKMRGAETPDSGFIKGYFYAIKQWSKGRREVEKLLIAPKQFWQDLINNPEKALYEKYHEQRENWLNKHKDIILQNSERNRQAIENWGEAKIQSLNATQEKLDNMISLEKSNRQISEQELQNYKDSNKVLMDKIQSLKLLQQHFVQEYNNCAGEINALASTVQKDSDKYNAIQEISNLSKDYYREECKNLNRTIDFANKILKFNEILYRKSNYTGFSRIAGYEDIKQVLRNKFINPIRNTDSNNSPIPDMILFHGPKGCGKTLFSHALAEESKCNVIEPELTLNSNKDFNNLQKAVEDAREIYEISGVHSIIRVDELDGFMPDKSFEPNEVQSLINLLSKNHCTLVGTTNYPNNVNTALNNSNSVNIYVGPPEPKDIQEVLKYYIKDFADTEINYQALTDILSEKNNDRKFSNAKIAQNIIYGLKENLIDNNSILNQAYFENIIKTLEPDIKK